MMSKLVRKYHILLLSALFFVLAGSFASAQEADMVDISLDPEGAFGTEFIFNETNILPGDRISRKIIVSNKTGDSRLVMFRFDPSFHPLFNNGLESELAVEIKKSDGQPVVFPFSPGMTLEDLYDDASARNIDILGPEASQSYEIVFTFDPLATDQRKNSAKFDLTLGVESEPYQPPVTIFGLFSNDDGDDDGNDNDGGGGRNRNTTGGIFSFISPLFDQPGEEGGEVSGETSSTEGERGDENANQEVFGVEDQCRSWPLWVWIAAAIAYLGIFNYNNLFRLGAGRFHWYRKIALFAGALAGWYFFDKCRDYEWFPLAMILISLFGFFYHLMKAKTE